MQIHEFCPQFSNEYLERIRSETSKDPELVALKEVVYTGWPATIKQLPSVVRPYWTFRDEIAIEDSLLLKGHRIIIPQSLQSEILVKLHTSHQGTEKTKLRARTSVFWRNLNRDIDDLTHSCTVCQEFQSKQSKEPLISTEVPPRPWHTVGTDLFLFDDDEYLIINDYYSKYPFGRKIPRGQSNSRTVVNLTKQIFSEHGVPQIVRSDNGPHFQGHYPEFAKEYGFQHVTSSPRYPRSNGFVESQVKNVKLTLKKAKKSHTDPNMALLCLRATPVDNKLASPAELLLGRPVQDNLPRKIPSSVNGEEVVQRLQDKQAKQKAYHDQHATALPSLVPGQSVTIRNHKTHTWEPAVVQEQLDVPRSYVVTTPTGGNLRRNRSQIREAHSKRVQFDLDQDETTPQVESPQLEQPQATQSAGSNTGSDTPYVTRYGRSIKTPKRMGS